ncbi:ATP-dependent Clp protease proteolytic subunit [Bernardetia sp. OM2101]|uniref:ATP-dependent Clp protease proteolytic subunit n=1 Tax=Bernardetia sp. OM2101 TaxID=3344876 RepID=UPI0035D094E6
MFDHKKFHNTDFFKFAHGHQNIPTTTLEGYAQNSIQNMTRSIIEERQTHFQEIDVFSRLMMDRIIFLGTGVDDHISNIIVAQLLFLESADPDKDVLMYINSPGGSVYAGLGIYDTMQYVKPDISTVCTGLAASMGAVLLTAGQKGKRAALPHARVMIHQPLGGIQGQASDIEITAKQILLIKKELTQILADQSGQDYETVERDCDRDYWMIAPEAKEYGLIDEVLERKKDK